MLISTMISAFIDFSTCFEKKTHKHFTFAFQKQTFSVVARVQRMYDKTAERLSSNFLPTNSWGAKFEANTS